MLKYITDNKWKTSLVINGLILVLVMLFATIQYEVSDDYIIESLISGAYGGETTPYMPFSNVILGFLISFFYKIYAGLNWYGIIMLFFSYVAISSVFYFLLDRVKVKEAVFLYTVLMIFFMEDTFIALQFTKVSVLLIMSGSLLFLHSVLKEKRQVEILLGAALVIVGSFYRYRGVYISGLYILSLVILILIEYKQYEVKAIKKASIYGILLVVAIIGSNKLDSVIRDNNQEISHYHDFNSLRGSLSDYPSYGYEENKMWLDGLGLSENDFLAATTWNYGDTDVFTMEKLEQIELGISETRKSKTIDFEWVKWKFMVQNYKMYLSLLGCVFMFVLFLKYRKKGLIEVLPCVLISSTLFIYFYMVQRVLYRVEYTIALSAFMYLLFVFTHRKKEVDYGKELYYWLIILLVFKSIFIAKYMIELNSYTNYKDMINATYYDSWSNEPMRYYVNKDDKLYGELIDEIKNNQDNYYLLDFGSTIQNLYLDKEFFQGFDAGAYKNVSYLTGVTSQYPTVLKQLEQSGINNPVKDLLEENVYYISNTPWRDDILLTFMHEHYGEDIEMIQENELSGYMIYKFTRLDK